MIKTSVCAYLLEMRESQAITISKKPSTNTDILVPFTFRKSRILVYTLAALIMSLGIAEVLVWLLQSQPIMSNFDFDVMPDWSLDIDWTRYCEIYF